LKGKKLELIEEIGKGSQATVWKGLIVCQYEEYFFKLFLIGTIDGGLVALKQVNLASAKGSLILYILNL